jgi:hypothetical protein
LAGADIQPRMVFAFYGCDHDDWMLHRYLSGRFPDAVHIGGSSFGGVMTHRGAMESTSIGLLLLEDSGMRPKIRVLRELASMSRLFTWTQPGFADDSRARSRVPSIGRRVPRGA